jgi:hypothetical protein
MVATKPYTKKYKGGTSTYKKGDYASSSKKTEYRKYVNKKPLRNFTKAMDATVPSAGYSLSYMNPFLYNVTPPKSPYTFGNSLTYTGLGRLSIDIPVSTRVVMMVNPGASGAYQMLTWLGNGANYELSLSAQPLAKMVGSGNTIDRTRIHRSAINIFNTTSGNDIGGIVKFHQATSTWSPSWSSANAGANADVTQNWIDLVLTEVNSDYSTRMVSGRSMGDSQHTVVISPNKWTDYNDFHDFESASVPSWAQIRAGLDITHQPFMTQFIVFEPSSHVQSYDISFSTQYSLQVANNSILSQVKQVGAAMMGIKDDSFLKSVIKKVQDARNLGGVVAVSEAASPADDTSRGRGRPSTKKK